jgi:undecaprenyl-diphosphatase
VTVLEATVLGLVQGLTEFLPVSSTAHLLFAQKLLGMGAKHDLWPEMATHLGTVLAVVAYYRRDFAKLARETLTGGEGRRTTLLVGLATAMLVLVVIVHKAAPAVKEWRFDVRVAAAGLIGVGLFLLGTAWVTRGARAPSAGTSVAMGVAQCVAAIVPGCSRSGSTIGTGLFFGLEPTAAARFSFWMSVPAVLGGSAYEILKEKPALADADAGPMLLAGFVAFASGFAAIHVLLTIVGRGKLHWFGPYCVAVGVAALIWLV